MSVTASISGNIKITDNLTGSTSLVKALNNAFTGVSEAYGQSAIIGISPVSIPLPSYPAGFVYVKNLSTTSTLSVGWTPYNESSVTLALNLIPGGIFITTGTDGTKGGLGSLTLSSTAEGTPVEYILAGLSITD